LLPVQPVATVSRKATIEYVPRGKPDGAATGVSVEVGFEGVSEPELVLVPVPVPVPVPAG
jgi:hypothetical protein